MGTGAEVKSKLKIFETAKRNYALIDLDASKRPFHQMQLLHIIEGFTVIALQCLYLVIDAKTDREYVISTLMLVSGFFVHLGYWSAIFETTTICELIDYFESIVNDSKLEYSIIFVE